MVGEFALSVMMTAIVPLIACPPELDIDVIAEHSQPTVRSNYSLSEIRKLAARLGRQGKHDPFGFYAASFGYTVDVESTAARMPGCKPAVFARVRLILGDRLIEIGSDLHTQGCARDVILAHYFLHAQFDDQTLSTYATRAFDLLKQVPTSELLGSQISGNIIGSTTDAIRRVMDEVLLPYKKDREQALALADNPEELSNLSGACVGPL